MRLVALICALLVSSLVLAQEAKTPADWTLTKVRVLPKPGNAAALADTRITGSNHNQTNGFVEIAKLPQVSSDGWIEREISPAKVYRFIKIESGNTPLSLAEIEFYTSSGKLTGKNFGTADKANPKAFEAALDGDPATSFDAPIDHSYVGIELPNEAQCPGVIFEPDGGPSTRPVTLKLRTWPSGPTIRYTIDGSSPSRDNGIQYSQPIDIQKTTSIAAFAYQPGRADSGMRVVTYLIGADGKLPAEVRTYHIGNSLTDTTKGSFDVIARSAGQNITTYYKTIPGCSLGGNWTNNAQGFGYPQGWANDYQKVIGMKLDHLFLQPFPNPPGLKHDGDSGVNFITLARQSNPDVQPWLYAQWISYPGIDKDGKVTAAYSDQVGGQNWNPGEPEAWYPPINKKDVKNWEDAMTNAGAYYRTILKRWNDNAPGNKPARIVPADKALVALKKAVDAGELQGVKDFGEFAFTDGLHLTPAGAYLVTLTHYACVFGESPEGKVTYATSRLSPEQAKFMQRLAWQTVTSDPDSGVKK